MKNNSYAKKIINSAFADELNIQRDRLYSLESKIKYIENFPNAYISVCAPNVELYTIKDEEIVFDVIQVLLLNLNLKIKSQKKKILELEQIIKSPPYNNPHL
jgi:hypothetical protein